jgi:hypothetical protein
MYNLICFPHYTCGGLLSDILNNTWSEVSSNGGLNSIQHSIGKIGDSNNVFVNFNHEEFNNIIADAINLNIPLGTWLGTHCWPGNIDLTIFNNIINVTTTTFKSKIYRWSRSYYHYYLPKITDVLEDELSHIDSSRENAKNYLIPFNPVHASNVYNIEFSEIVEENPEFLQLIKHHNKTALLKKHMNRWKGINEFLYRTDFWTDFPVLRFYEAESEHLLGKQYVYR